MVDDCNNERLKDMWIGELFQIYQGADFSELFNSG